MGYLVLCWLENLSMETVQEKNYFKEKNQTYILFLFICFIISF